jgi:hypothetical protein
MPIYSFFCEKCNSKKEFFLKMCGGDLVRDYSEINVGVEISKPKTIGDVANANTEKAVKEGKLHKSALEFDSRKAEKKKQYSKMKEIADMTPTQKRNYIMTGNKKG